MTMENQDRTHARVLVVDDEAHIVQVVALKFRNAGLEVATAGDGDEALALLEREPFELVVTDLQMPAMSGIELARAMAERPALAQIPVLMLTARGHLLREGEADSANIARVVHKPFSPRGLLADVMELLDRARSDDADRRAA
ncbi:MAG: response regulator [Phycisphaerales bacterium]|jgi:DNA-binding response OmpR family regulator